MKNNERYFEPRQKENWHRGRRLQWEVEPFNTNRKHLHRHYFKSIDYLSLPTTYKPPLMINKSLSTTHSTIPGWPRLRSFPSTFSVWWHSVCPPPYPWAPPDAYPPNGNADSTQFIRNTYLSHFLAQVPGQSLPFSEEEYKEPPPWHLLVVAVAIGATRWLC